MTDVWTGPLRVLQFLLRDADAATEDPLRLVDAAVDSGANAILLNAGGFSAWYPTRLAYQRRNPFLRGDFLGQAVEAAQRRGLRLLARLDISKTHPEIAAVQPDWLRRRADGTPSTEWQMPETCFTGPYWQHVNFEILDEMLGAYPVDGLFYNMYRVAHCHCPRCQVTVGGVPPVADAADPAWRAYELWRRAALVEYTRRVRDRLHAQRPQAALLVYHHQKEGWDVPGIARASDLVSVTASSPLTVNPLSPQRYWVGWPGYEAALARGLRPERPGVVVTTTSALFASRRAAQPPDRLRASMLQVAFGRGAVCPAVPGGLTQEDPRALPVVQDSLAWLAAQADLFDGLASAARVALLTSRDSLDLCPMPGEGELSRHEEWGAYLALNQAQYPFDLVPLSAGGLELGGYGAAVLPNAACLDTADAAAVDTWVAQGGTLIASGRPGAFDARGEPRAASPLRALGEPRFGQARDLSGGYLSVDGPDLRQALAGTSVVGVDGDLVEVTWGRPPDWQDLHLRGPVANNTPEFALVPSEPGPAGLLGWRLGQGRGWLLPWRPGVLVSQHGLPDPAGVLTWLVRQAVGPAPFDLAGVTAVEARLWLQPERRRALLFLLNEAARQTRPLVQHAPIGPIEIRLRRPCTRVQAVVASRDLPLAPDAGDICFTLPRLGAFEVLVFEGAA